MRLSFFDYELKRHGGRRSMRFLREMHKLIPWKEIEKLLIERGIYKPNKGKQGLPSIPASTLIGALFLQSWYGLSDPMIEELIHDRISFRKFLDITEDETIPDETTICKFRNALIREGLLTETKYRGLHKNAQYHYLIATAYNLRRMPALIQRG